MGTAGLIRDLYGHMEWADAATWSRVLARAGDADEKLNGYFYHLHLVQRAFLRLWRGEPRETAYPAFEQAVALMRWGQSYYRDVRPWLDDLSEDKLAGVLVVPWAAAVRERLGRAPETTSLADTILQVPMHSTYHRGQINARLRELGGQPTPVDYIAWIWLGRPRADWPLG